MIHKVINIIHLPIKIQAFILANYFYIINMIDDSFNRFNCSLNCCFNTTLYENYNRIKYKKTHKSYNIKRNK